LLGKELFTPNQILKSAVSNTAHYMIQYAVSNQNHKHIGAYLWTRILGSEILLLWVQRSYRICIWWRRRKERTFLMN